MTSSVVDQARTTVLLPHRFTNVFESMEAAEQEIVAAQARHTDASPDANAALWEAFKLLCPANSKAALGATPALYRAHCRELLDRIARGEDVRPATTAEIVSVLSETSLTTPLTPAAECLYVRLFVRVFGVGALGEATASQQNLEALYKRQADALLEDLSRKLRMDSRAGQ